MRHLAPGLALAALLVASPARAQDPGPVFTASLGGGAEAGLDDGEPAGVGELELTAGYDLTDLPIRPEVAVVIGLQPDTHAGVRAGLRWLFRDTPFAFRTAFEWSSARNESLSTRRFLLVGVAAELRVTGAFGLFAEFDTGIPLNSTAGVPFLFRGGASVRL